MKLPRLYPPIWFLLFIIAALALRQFAPVIVELSNTIKIQAICLTTLGGVLALWAKWLFRGEENAPLFYGDAHPDGDDDGDFHPPPDATLADAAEAYWREVRDADAIYAEASLDDMQAVGKERNSLRWIYVHLIEEYARHCGHADLIRQAIDGQTDD